MSDQKPLIPLPYFFGCPMWSHKHWFKNWMPAQARGRELAHYSQWFNSVEGNTSFYSLPSETSLKSWQQQTPESFLFTFKFPQSISHSENLRHQRDETDITLRRFTPLASSIGCLMLQLPSRFGPDRLAELDAFLEALPDTFEYGVEVRHPAFFAKGEDEKRFNQMLMKYGVNRVIMDTRGLFAAPPASTLVADVQQKKPKVPTHVIATGKRPIVRIVGHQHLSENPRFLLPWVHKLAQWLEEGFSPYLFFHMADNAEAPWLAEMFFTLLAEHYPHIPRPSWTLPAFSTSQFDLF